MDKYVSVDTIWVLIGAFLVFSMQPGFAMVETGFTRAKNAGNIVMKNVMDMCLGSIVFWVLGFGLMFGTDIGGFIGAPDFFVKGDYGASYPSTAYFIFRRCSVLLQQPLFPVLWQNVPTSWYIAFTAY